MPVLGHMFVGLATGMATRPPAPGPPRGSRGGVLRDLWAPIAVLLAYAPDVCSEALRFAGWTAAPLVCHSLLFAAAFPTVVAFVLRAAGVPSRRVFSLALFSVVVHDLLDVAQSTDKMPFWPFSHRTISPGPFRIPSGMFAETILFVGLFILFILVRRILKRDVPFSTDPAVEPSSHGHRLATVRRASVASIIVLAAATHSLRDLRERQLEAARVLIEGGRYAEGMVALDASERWPSPAKPGRADYLRGIAFLGSGDRDKAERHLLRSFRADPAYPWVVIDLAVFYAESRRPLPLRRHLAAPYLEALHRDFPDRKEAADAASRVEAILFPEDRRSP